MRTGGKEPVMLEKVPVDAVKLLPLSELITAALAFSVEIVAVLNNPWLALTKVVLLMPPRAVWRPVVRRVLVVIALELTTEPELSRGTVADTTRERLLPCMTLALERFWPAIWTVEIAGSYAQSAMLERLEVVAIGMPFRSRTEPKPEPAVSIVLPSSVMLVVLMEEMYPVLT